MFPIICVDHRIATKAAQVHLKLTHHWGVPQQLGGRHSEEGQTSSWAMGLCKIDLPAPATQNSSSALLECLNSPVVQILQISFKPQFLLQPMGMTILPPGSERCSEHTMR